MPRPSERLAWRAARTAAAQRTGRRQAWSAAEKAKLEKLVGRATVEEMAVALGRTPESIRSRLRNAGHTLSRSVLRPLGLNVRELAEYVGQPYQQVWRDVQTGVIPRRKLGRRDYRIEWRAVRQYARRVQRIHARRARALAQITEPTLTKGQFMALVGLGETQAMRYLAGGIVRGWKVPTQFTDPGRDRWEWLVSAADAERVRQERNAGQLRMEARRYRRMLKAEQARINAVRQAWQGGQRHYQPRLPVPAGHLTIQQVAMRVGLVSMTIRDHVRTGRLPVVRYQVGRRQLLAIPETALPAFEAWVRDPAHLKPERHPWRFAVQSIRAAGRLTILDVVAEYGASQSAVRTACSSGKLPSVVIGGLRGILPADAAQWAGERQAKEARRCGR